MTLALATQNTFTKSLSGYINKLYLNIKLKKSREMNNKIEYSQNEILPEFPRKQFV